MSCGLRDVVEFESDPIRPRPAVLVASGAFAQAAERQTELLGQPELNYVLVDHPVQDRTDDEVRAMAREAVGALLAAIS